LKRTARGLARTFQAVRLFRDMSVIENLEVAGIGAGLSGQQARLRAWDVLVWMNLEHKAHIRADALSYGDERRVGLARALAAGPKFIFLDEPAAGTNDVECDELMALIARIPERFGCGVLLIEHNMRMVMGVCQRIYVLDGGRPIAEGPAADIQRHPEVIRAYLGTKSEKVRA
jgi:branched-chain amino acid transport system ATP-binding protein